MITYSVVYAYSRTPSSVTLGTEDEIGTQKKSDYQIIQKHFIKFIYYIRETQKI